MLFIDVEDAKRLKVVSGLILLYLSFSVAREMISLHYFAFAAVFRILCYLIMAIGCLTDKDKAIGTGALMIGFLEMLTVLRSSFTGDGFDLAYMIYGWHLLRSFAFIFLWLIMTSRSKINTLTCFLPFVLLAVSYAGSGLYNMNSLLLLLADVLLCLTATIKKQVGKKGAMTDSLMRALIGLVGSLLPILIFVLMYELYPDTMDYYFGPTDSDYFLLFAMDIWSSFGAPLMLTVGFFVSLVIYRFAADEAESLAGCIGCSLLTSVIVYVICALLHFIIEFLLGLSPLIAVILFVGAILAMPTIPVVQVIDW